MSAIGEENSVDSEDEARRYDYGLYLMKRLIQIKHAQLNRKRMETLLKAFCKWSYEFPLAQKCDEMAKQLRERNLMMDTVRSSYLRDVVSIKYHLDKINSAQVDEDNPSLVKLQQNMYDLHTLPSVDLRQLVDNARASVGQSSAQLRESLVDAGLLDPETLRTLNPWDQSRGYRRLMRIKKGGAAKPPDLEGESIAIAAPSNKKLFVRYCKDCIGLSTFIKDWNREVELSLKFKADFSNIDALIQEYRNVIEKLNGTIEGQEKEIVRLLDHTSKLETANAWFEKWGMSKEGGKGGSGSGGIDDIDEVTKYKHNAEMAHAEVESFAFNAAIRFEAKERQHLAAEKIQRQRLREAEILKDADSKERVKIVQDFRKCQQDLQSRINDISELTQANAVKEAEKTHLNQKLASAEAEKTVLHGVIDKKEEEYATLREETNIKIDDLNYQIRQLNDDYNNQENTIDELRDNLANKKLALQDHANEISDLKKRVRELEAQIPAPKPRFTLRVVAIAVRYLMRLHRMLRHKEFESMGKLGYNELIRRQDKYVKMLTNANDKLQRQLFALDQRFHFQAEELLSYRCVLKDRNVELLVQNEVKEELRRTRSLLRHTVREKEEAIAKGASTVEAQNVIINQRVHGALSVQHDHHLQQAKVYAQIQRNMGHHLADSLFRVRSVIASMDIDSDMAILRKPYEAAIPSLSSGDLHSQHSFSVSDASGKVPPTQFLLSKPKSAQSLMMALRTKSRFLAAWIKKHHSRSKLIPKRVPVVLFREPKPGESQESVQKDKAQSLQVMSRVIQHDFQHIEDMRNVTNSDMRKVQDYLYALKNKHNELLLQVKLLEEELREERMPSQSSRTTRKRIGDIKSSFSHKMHSVDADHKNSYFSSVLSAIQAVQEEHGELFKDKLLKSGKFKLTEIAREIVRRNSKELIPSFIENASVWTSVKLENAKSAKTSRSSKGESNPPSRKSSFGGYPLSRLTSVQEIDHEADGSPVAASATTTSAAAGGVGADAIGFDGDASAGGIAGSSGRSFRGAPSGKHSPSRKVRLLPEHPEEQDLEDLNKSDRSIIHPSGAAVVGEVKQYSREKKSSSKSPKKASVRINPDSEQQSSAVKTIDMTKKHGAGAMVSEIDLNGINGGKDHSRRKLFTNEVEEDDDDLELGRLSGHNTERSFTFEGDNKAPPASALKPPERKESVAELSTVGFESSSSGDEEDDDDDDDDDNNSNIVKGDHIKPQEEDDEVDEDILYMEDLLAARDEMRGLLTREEVIQTRIRQAEEDREYLESQVKNLEFRLETKKREFVELEQKVYVSTGEQKQLRCELVDLAHQNDLLREIVEEDYRFHASNMQKALKEKEEVVISRFVKKVETAEQGTQIACAVCALKEEGMQGIAPRVHGNNYDDSTVAMVNDQFTKALCGEVVLIAKPRRINKKSHQRSNQETSDTRISPANHLRGFEELLQNPPTQAELNKIMRRPASGSEAFDRPDRSASASPSMGFSELLMKHLDSTLQQNQQPPETLFAPVSNSNNNYNNKQSSQPEGSKFSRIKKMPMKNGSSSNADLNSLRNPAATAAAQRPHSATLATVKLNLDQRTESHTAAYLQNRLMSGIGSSPQVAPVSSSPYVPLHTVDLACTPVESTSAYLANAVQNKQNKVRASSASAARIERTNSENLLVGPVVGSESIGYSNSATSLADITNSSAQAAVRVRGQCDVRVPLPLRGDGVAMQKNLKFINDFADDLSDADAGVEFV